MRINRFAFDAEIVFIAHKLNFKIKELPISLQNPKRTSVRIVSDSLNMLLDLIKIRLNDLNNVYASEPAQKMIVADGKSRRGRPEPDPRPKPLRIILDLFFKKPV